MELTQQPNPTKIATKWAIISVLTSIVITYVIQFLDIDPNSPVKYIGFITFIAFLLLAQKEYKDALGGFISFKEAFSPGLRYAIFTGVLMAVFLFIYLKFLSPEVLDKSIAASRDQMVAKGLSDDQIDKAMDMTKKYGPVFGAFGAAIFDAVLGIIVALIGAAIFKRERTHFDIVEEETPADPTV